MIGVKIRREIQSAKNAGAMIQNLIDLGFHKVSFEEFDGSTIGVTEPKYVVTAETYYWNLAKNVKSVKEYEND